MARDTADYRRADHGRTLMAAEPLVFHCNHYNYWLQKTLLLDESVGMDEVIIKAATETAYSLLEAAASERKAERREQKVAIARDTFSELGFGVLDLSQVNGEGGKAVFPMSHYGATLREASGADFARPQSLFDAGYAAAAAAFVEGRPASAFSPIIETCQSMGSKMGLVMLEPASDREILVSPGLKHHGQGSVPAPYECAVDEPAILEALSGLDLSGNEEGLIPRFGVMLTHHFANFYNRISFEFLHRMADSGLIEAGEMLLSDAGYRCGFHTFGGIMISGEWDAVVRPQLTSREDWVHGMVAVVNALGWGVWRVAEVSDDRLVVRIWDDYESCGYLDMYGEAERPVSMLAAGGVAGIMNLVHIGDIASKPTLDDAFYARIFEDDAAFRAEQTKSLARGDDYTEIVATRG